MNQYIQISGLEDCLKLFDNAPENAMKVTKQALRDATRISARQMRSKTPKRWQPLVKYKVRKSRRTGKLGASFGLLDKNKFGGHQNPGGPTREDWFKAYWLNYGTLEGRDPSHHFTYPIKHGKTAAAAKRKNRMGIQHRNFFETAASGWEGPFVSAFRDSLKKNEDKFYDR